MLKLNAPLRAECADFVKREEGLKLTAYICPGGVKTIGYGHALKPGESVKEITEEAALYILREDLGNALDAIDTYVTVKLNDNQIVALCSFIFNVGVDAFRKSTLLKKLNAHAKLSDVASEFARWDKVKGSVVLNGLVKRRKKEADLFLTPVAAPLATTVITVQKKKPWFLELLERFLGLRAKA